MFKSKYFSLGSLVMTRRISEEVGESDRFALEVALSLQRYCVKDWGDLTDEDKESNEQALNYPDDWYLLAGYETCRGRIWIITNNASGRVGDNVTTICFPEEI